MSKSEVAFKSLYLFILSYPFYFFSSGGFQISTIFLILSFIFSYHIKYNIYKNSFILVFLLLVIYISIVNFSHSIINTNLKINISTFYYLTNFIFIITVTKLFFRDPKKFLTLLKKSILVSIFLQLILLPVSISEGGRQTLFFNNPNQLGYWSLLLMGLITLFSQEMKALNVKTLGVASLILILFSLYSLSKAAIISLILLVLITYLYRFSIKSISTILLLIATVFITFQSFLDPILFTAEKRIRNIGDANDDNLTSRGYDRIANHVEYLVFGAGEGDFSRFDSELSGEIHSTFGTLFFSYGIIGLLIFGIILLKAILNGKKSSLILLPILMYGITHNGLRSPFFYLILFLLINMTYIKFYLRSLTN